MLHSNFTELNPVVFPAYQARQKYMQTFDVANPIMAEGYDDYLSLVMALCKKAGVESGVAHMTVDEKVVAPGFSQRRPGAHVDGKFMPSLGHWGHGGWNHYCNAVPLDRMAVIVAADVPGCIAYQGHFAGKPKEDGDLEHIRDQLDPGTLLKANVGYLLSPDCVHESVVFQKPTQRMFLRIAISPEE